MWKLVVALIFLGALAAGVLAVPIQGRTVAERWSAAADPGAFARNAWREARAALEPDGTTSRDGARRAVRPAAAEPRRRGRGAPAPHPVEHHTPEDRAALDRLVSERSR